MADTKRIIQCAGVWSLVAGLFMGAGLVPAQAQATAAAPGQALEQDLGLGWARAEDPDFPEAFSDAWVEQFRYYTSQFLAALSASGGTQIPHASSDLSSAFSGRSPRPKRIKKIRTAVRDGLVRMAPADQHALGVQLRDAMVRVDGLQDAGRSAVAEMFTTLVLTLFNQPALHAPSFFQSGARLLKFILQTLSANDVDIELGPAETKPSDQLKEPNPIRDAVLGNVISVIVESFGDLPNIYISDI